MLLTDNMKRNLRDLLACDFYQEALRECRIITPQDEDDWNQLILYWATNINRKEALKSATLMSRWAGCPYDEELVRSIVVGALVTQLVAWPVLSESRM